MVVDLHTKSQVNIYKRLEKCPKNCLIAKMSKAHNFAKNRWSVMKLKPDLQVMVIDLHAKIQVNICKDLGKKSRKLILRTDRHDGWTDR